MVGGLVPSLLIDQEKLPENVTPHVGTLDLDLGLAFALVGEQRYQDVVERLRNAKFTADVNEDGKPTRQRWRISDPPVTVDFLIEPETGAEAQAGRLFPLTKDWAAIIAPGLHLAFRNNQVVTLDGRTIIGETAKRDIRVCGAGAFVVLKALAFHIRGENKDAYDLFYLLRITGAAFRNVAAQFHPFLPDASAVKAMECLQADFNDSESIAGRGGLQSFSTEGDRTRTVRRMRLVSFDSSLSNASEPFHAEVHCRSAVEKQRNSPQGRCFMINLPLQRLSFVKRGSRFDSLAPPSLFCRKVKAKRGKYCLLLVFETIYTICGGTELASF